jgi:AraC-like DNA-binding protein
VKSYRPLLVQELNLRLPTLRLRRLRLHRHLPEVDQLSEHQHPFCQVLCYLSGRGRMSVPGTSVDVAPGTVLFLPPRVPHAFAEHPGRRALCAVVDFDWRGAGRIGFRGARLPQAASTNLRKNLGDLARLGDLNAPANRLAVAATTLGILDILLRVAGVITPVSRSVPSFVKTFDRLVRQPALRTDSIVDLARRMGYQPDYLNRIFREATGNTLRDHRESVRLEQARHALRRLPTVAAAAAALGFNDQNYFARWFKAHTGIPPSAFKRSATIEA